MEKCNIHIVGGADSGLTVRVTSCSQREAKQGSLGIKSLVGIGLPFSDDSSGWGPSS